MIETAIRGIVFDLDGVLIQSIPCHRAAFEQVFDAQGIHNFEYASYAGWRTPDVIADVFLQRGRTVPSDVIAEMASEKTRLARRCLDITRPLARNCEAALARWAAEYRLGLASSGSQSSVDAFLRLTGSRSLFGTILKGEDVTRAKPNPEIYERSAQALGLVCAECLVVEDAVAGIVAARAAGSPVVGVEGTCSGPTLRNAGAATVIAELRELTDLLPRGDARPLEPARWTAVIPAAGSGSRLGFSQPKILYPVGGRLILDWLLDFLVPTCSALIFVLSPSGVAEVVRELERRIPGRFIIAIQKTPTGMGNAVELALPSVQTRSVAVVWGDQVALRRESVESCMRLHQGPLEPSVTCPTVVRANPYIHFDRDSAGRLISLKQAREGDFMPELGESDTGFFCFETATLRRLFAGPDSESHQLGAATGEFNLLPLVPLAAREGVVLTPRLMSPDETVGINNREDAAAVEEFLDNSHGG